MPPPATIEAASNRASALYRHAIWNVTEVQEDADTQLDTTSSFWPATAPQDAEDTGVYPLFLDSVLPGEITRRSIIGNMPKTQHDNPIGETQGTSSSQNNSYNVSDTSSVARFPSFSFSLNCLTSLSSVSIPSEGIKVNVLLVVIELDGPDTITIKTGRDQGKQVSVLKILASDDRDNICTVTAWREVAEAWSGAESDVIATKRGDVVFLENVMLKKQPNTLELTGSPFLKSKLEICYRTLPYAHEDMRLRPDLRLGASDATVRKVASLVGWFENMAGLAH